VLTLSLLCHKETLPEAVRTTPDDATTSSNGEAFFSSDLHQPKTLQQSNKKSSAPSGGIMHCCLVL